MLLEHLNGHIMPLNTYAKFIPKCYYTKYKLLKSDKKVIYLYGESGLLQFDTKEFVLL